MLHAVNRVGNGISFRENSAEQTRNDFRYSAEESAHSEAFRVPSAEEPIPKFGTEQNGTESREKIKFYGTRTASMLTLTSVHSTKSLS